MRRPRGRCPRGADGISRGWRPRPENRHGRSLFTQQIARAVRGGFAEGMRPPAAPAAARGSANIRAFVFPASPIVAEGFGRSPGLSRAIERGQIRSPARLTGARRLGCAGSARRAGGNLSPPRVEERMRFLAVAALLVLSVGGCWLATQYVASEPRVRARARAPLGDARRGAPLRSVAVDRLGPALRAPRARSSFATRAPSPPSPPWPVPARPPWRPCAASPRPVAAPTAARAGRRPRRCKRAGLLRDAGVVLCQTNDAEFRTTIDSAGTTRTTARRASERSYATTAPSTSSASRPRAAARAWASSSRRSSPGRTRCSSTTSRRRTGR